MQDIPTYDMEENDNFKEVFATRKRIAQLK